MPVYEFGAFVLDPSERRLTASGEPIALPPRIFDTLVILVEAGGKTVDKATFFSKLWPDTVVEERNLTVNISTLRKVLNSDSDEGLIETVPKRGYRLRGPIRVAPDPPPAFEVAAPSASLTVDVVAHAEPDVLEPHRGEGVEPPVSKRRWSIGWAALLAGVLVVVTGLALGSRFFSARSTATLAVLPFQMVGVSDDEQYLGLGIADAVITQLGGLGGLAVRPTTSVRGYTQPDLDVLAIGRALQVDHILGGLVQRYGDRVRVTVQLTDATNGMQRWSDRIDERATDLFALQDAVSKRVASALVERSIAARSAGAPTRSTEAYRLYMQGRANVLTLTSESVTRAVTLFQQAIALDDRFALAHAALAEAYRLQSAGLVGPVAPGLAESARAEAQKALSLDSQLSEAHTVLGLVQYANFWEWEPARVALERAVALNAGSAEAHRGYGLYLLTSGNLEQGLRELTEARRLDPTSTAMAENLAMALDYSGKPDQALGELEAASKLEPTGSRPHFRRVLILDRLKRVDEALAARQVAARLAGYAALADEIGRLFVASGYEAVLEHMSRVHAERKEPMQATYVALARGRREEALDHLEVCARLRNTVMVYLKVDPAFAPLRGHPRFVSLIAKVGL